MKDKFVELAIFGNFHSSKLTTLNSFKVVKMVHANSPTEIFCFKILELNLITKQFIIRLRSKNLENNCFEFNLSEFSLC